MFAKAMSMPFALVYLFEYKSVVHYCGADGIYKRRGASPVVSTSEHVDLMSDEDEDIFCLAEEPERKRPKIDDLGTVPADVEKLYKYKHRAVAFARSGNSLFSLHQGRVKHKFHVERTDITKFSCENGCLLRLDGSSERPWLISAGLVLYAGVSEDGAHRILLGRDCEVSTLREAALKWPTFNAKICFFFQVSHTEFVKGFGSSVHVFEAGALQSLLNFPDLPGGKGDDLIEGILRKQTLSVNGVVRRFTRDEISALHPIRDGCLVLLKSGKVWQYAREYDTTKVVKSVLPLKRVSLLSLSDCGEKAAVCTESGGVYIVTLPYARAERAVMLKESPGQVRLTRDEIVEDIIECATELRELNEERAKQRKVLEQLKIVTSLKDKSGVERTTLTCDCSVVSFSALQLRTCHELSLKVTNSSEFAFDGDNWTLGVRISSASDGEKRQLVDCMTLPGRFCPGDSFCATISLPEEYCTLKAMPILISGDFCFTHTGKGKSVVWAENVMTAELRAVDFLSNHPEKEDTTLHDSPDATNFPITIPTRFMNGNESEKPSLKALRNAVMGNFALSLFNSNVKVEVVGSKMDRLRVRFSSSDRETVLALKAGLTSMLIEHVADAGQDVEVSKALISEADVIREEVGFMGDDESEENEALLEQYFKRLRFHVSSELM